MVELLKCPVCASKKISLFLETEDYFFTNEKFSLSQCDSCNFVFTNPIPQQDEIGKYYETETYLSHDSTNKGIIGSIYNKVRQINLKNKYSIVSKYKSTGSILDIGCGTGELLNYFEKEKWQTLGIEPNEGAREFAKANYNISVKEESELNRLDSKSHDVISMWHVLEHVYNLNDRMNSVVRILKEDGVAIIALPMVDSPDSIKFKKYWAGLDVPRHLYHFSAKTFELLVKKHKLKVIGKYPMKFDSLYVSWLSNKALNKRFAFIHGVVDGLVSNGRANKLTNYSSMIFILQRV